MTKNKYIYYGIFALVMIGIIFVVSYVQQTSKQDKELSVSYHYTAEFRYFDANITNSKLVYTYVDEELIGRRLEPNTIPQQRAYWTNDDLKTKEAELTENEVKELRDLIEETKIMQLNNYYGPEQGARCYPYTLKITLGETEKEITYCSRPDGPSRPGAFTKVSGKIQEIVTQKFSK